MANILEEKFKQQTKRLPRLCSSAPLEMSKPARKNFPNQHIPGLIKSASLTGQAALELAVLGSLILVVFASVLSYGQRFDSQLDLKMEAFRKALNRSYARNASVSYTVKKDKRFYNLLGNFGEGQPTSLSASASVMWQKGQAGCQHGEEGCENKRKDGTTQSSFVYYEINNQLIGLPDGEVPGNDIMIPRYPKKTKSYTEQKPSEFTIVKVPASIYAEESKRKTELTTTSTKQERPLETFYRGGDPPTRVVIPSRIVNAQQMSLKENIYTTLHFRFDKADNNSLEKEHVPDYIDEGTDYAFDTDNYPATPDVEYKIYGSELARQGAYYNTLNNRIEYDPTVAEGSTVSKSRNWTTKF